MAINSELVCALGPGTVTRSRLEVVASAVEHTSEPLSTRRHSALNAKSLRSVKLSIVMPAYNEEPTIRLAIDQILNVDLPCEVELIIVDDGSSDATGEVIDALNDTRVVKCRHPFNLGKGSAVRTGAAMASGTHLLIFDADVEYDPEDIPMLLTPIISGMADVVYGARIFGNHTVYPSMRFAIGNRLTTLAANILFDSYVTDLHTCLKLIPLDLFRQLALSQHGFGLDSEITAELLRRGVRPFEVPVSYRGRSRAQGKKITWLDGVQCLAVLTRVRMRGLITPVEPVAPLFGTDCGLGLTSARV